MKKLILLLALALPLSAQVPQAANWVHIASEGQVISLTQPATIQVCGDAQHCTAPVVVSSWPITIVWGNGTAASPAVLPVWGLDPQFGTAKTIGAIQTGQLQPFTVDGVSAPVAALPLASVWRFVCPTNCNILGIAAGTAGTIPLMKVGSAGTPFSNSPNTITKATGPVFVQQDGVNAFTFTWSDDWEMTVNQTTVGAIGSPVVTPISACIKFSFIPPYAAILCGPIATHLTSTAVTMTSSQMTAQ
jgi:hypothetical protein